MQSSLNISPLQSEVTAAYQDAISYHLTYKVTYKHSRRNKYFFINQKILLTLYRRLSTTNWK